MAARFACPVTTRAAQALIIWRLLEVTSVVDRRRCPVLLLADLGAPRCAGAVVVDLEHRDVGHEARRRGAVPVILTRTEEHAVARADDLDGLAAALREADALGDVDGLAVGMGVPRRPRARREVDAGRAQARGLG